MRGTIGKAGELLALFTPERPEWGAAEAAAALGMARSSAHDLLVALAGTGLVARTGDGRFRVGWRALTLTRALEPALPFRDAARERMALLSHELGRTLHLAALDGGEVVYLDKREGRGSMPIPFTGVGLRQPAHCTAVGKVLLAHAGADAVTATVERHGLVSRTRRTITTLERLVDELGRVRARGCAYDVGEVRDDLCCVAAPVRDADGAVRAALSVSVPARRFRADSARYRRVVVEAARDVSLARHQ